MGGKGFVGSVRFKNKKAPVEILRRGFVSILMDYDFSAAAFFFASMISSAIEPGTSS